jgi:hypothetical protein
VDEKEFIPLLIEMPPEDSFELCESHLHAV